MKSIYVRNVHQALPEGLRALELEGIKRNSRNGEVFVFDGPVATCYEKPCERVLFWADRDANPFFHLFESLWMLAGRQDVKFVSQFVKRMISFSDDGKVFHSAYGHRWRKHFDFDQLPKIIAGLKANPDDRRQVLAIWDARTDLSHEGRDLPCNIIACFAISVHGKLDMTVYNRSNDMIWGAYGANAVHFSVLQEYIAAGIGVEVGRYWQVSNNFHAYLNTYEPIKHLADKAPNGFSNSVPCPYEFGTVKPYPMFNTPLDEWEQDLAMFMAEGPTVGLRDPFFRRVATPMWYAHLEYRKKTVEGIQAAREIMEQCEATDWKLACLDWLDRREKALRKAQDDGVDYDTKTNL